MYNFIDLFCGGGGFSKGFEMAGLNCIGAIDNVEPACKTHALNHKHSKTLCADIRNMPPEQFAEEIGTNTVDVIIGGPPCPTFSTIGQAKIRSVTKKDVSEDPRNRLFLEYLKYVDYFRPNLFVIENVPNFITKYNGKVFKTAIAIIENIGKNEDGTGEGIYEIVPVQVLNSVYYGVPQVRRRMLLVAHKKSAVKFEYPEPTHYYDQSEIEGLKHFTTVKEAISDLPRITDNWRISEMEYSKKPENEYQRIMRSNTGDVVDNNICRMSNKRAKQVFEHMKQGDIYMDLPPEVRKILPFREDIFPDRLKRLVNDQPSWTVIAHIGMDGYMYIHPTETRTLSVREAARIQSFPDEFRFIGNQQETYVQVGNAVPPLMAKALGMKVIEFLDQYGGKADGLYSR